MEKVGSGNRDGKNSDPGSVMRDRKNSDLESGMEKIRIRDGKKSDPGMEKSRIRDGKTSDLGFCFLPRCGTWWKACCAWIRRSGWVAEMWRGTAPIYQSSAIPSLPAWTLRRCTSPLRPSHWRPVIAPQQVHRGRYRKAVLRIRDPVPFWPLDPGWTTRIIFPRAKKPFLGLKNA